MSVHLPGPIVVIGVDHQTCPDSIRERIFVSDEELKEVLGSIISNGGREAIAVSTCDRVEVWGVFEQQESAQTIVAEALGAPIGLPADLLAPFLFLLEGEEALRHIFRVASSLESQVVGEPQVLGQVRAAYKQARELGASGPVLDRMMTGAFEAAKQVRSETKIGEGAVSLAAAAVRRVLDLFGSLEGRSALLIGAGEMGVLTARHMIESGLGDLIVVDPVERRAIATARDLEVHHGSFEPLGPALERADVAIASMGQGSYLVSAEEMEAVLRKRRGRPVFVLDLAVPSDMDPAIHRLEDAFLYDADDLERLTINSRMGREREAQKAEQIVESALVRFTRGVAEDEAGEEISALRQEIEWLVREAVGDGPEADQLVGRIVGRLAHKPSVAIRKMAAEGRLDNSAKALLSELFGLGSPDPKSGEEGNRK